MATATTKNEIMQIWNSDTGSWRAKFRKIQAKAGLAVAPDEMPESRVESQPPEDNALLAVAELKTTIVTLQNENADLKAKLAATADVRAQLDRTTLNYDRLKKSLGISAALSVVDVPKGESRSLIDIYNAITDGAEKTAFYQKHQAELSKLILKS